jgi:F-type H+-transporting ATPase subunit gamma
MQTIQQLEKRIDNTRDLRSVVSTMKGMAAVNIRQYERAAEALSGYYRTVESGFQMLLHRQPGALAHLHESAGDGAAVAILFGSDQGMCGPINRSIADAASAFLRDHAGNTLLIGAAGARAAGELASRGHPPDARFELPGSVSGLTSRAWDILLQIQEWRGDHPGARIVLFHNRPKGGASFEARQVTLLPVDPAMLDRLASEPRPNNQLPFYRATRRELAAALVREYLFAALFRAFAESLASENASRLASMQAADKNIGERLGRLEQDCHRRRQAAITEELLDLVGGFEALRKKRA